MKNSTIATVGAVIVGLVMVWLAWRGFELVRWRVRYMMPSFIAGALFGGAIVAMFTGGRD